VAEATVAEATVAGATAVVVTEAVADFTVVAAGVYAVAVASTAVAFRLVTQAAAFAAVGTLAAARHPQALPDAVPVHRSAAANPRGARCILTGARLAASVTVLMHAGLQQQCRAVRLTFWINTVAVRPRRSLREVPMLVQGLPSGAWQI
jgi:hypothetical protein